MQEAALSDGIMIAVWLLGAVLGESAISYYQALPCGVRASNRHTWTMAAD